MEPASARSPRSGRPQLLSEATVEATAECWACGHANARRLPRYENVLYGCPACGFAFQPRRSHEDLTALYDRDYFASELGAAAASHRAREARVRIEVLERHGEPGSLLEIGSAGGHFLAAARHAGFEALGVEPSPETAQAAMKGFDVAVRIGGVEHVELEEAAFDMACAWHSLEHIADPWTSLKRVRRALRPGGLFFVEVPNFDSIRSRREGLKWPSLQLAYHVGQYGPRSLDALLRRAEFSEISLETVPFGVYRSGPRRTLSYVKHAAVLRSWPRGTHPTKHELLRAVARRLP